MQTSILLGRKARDNKKISLKTPLYRLTVIETNPDEIRDLKNMESYIKDELNVLELSFDTEEEKYVVYKSEPLNDLCGKAFGKNYKDLKPKL